MSRYSQHSNGRMRCSPGLERALNWIAAAVIGWCLGAIAGSGF